MSSSTAKKAFFDLHITGIGYVNRIRDVKPKKGDSFLACTIAALTGLSDSPDYCYFDAKVSGSAAQHLIRRCEQAEKANRKVLIGFRLGDLWTDIFTYAKGEKAGKTGVSLKARLLFISWIKIDGQLEYKAERKDEAKPADDMPRENVPKSSSASPDASESFSDGAATPADAASF